MMSSAASQYALQIRLLGEVQVWRAGRRLELPPSKKTRALLGYLLLTRRAQRRERLCELFWDVADDPRAALRWSLSKLREPLDEPGRTRLVADRAQVAIDVSDVSVDTVRLKELLASGPELAASEVLEGVLPLFRGELLEGLDLPEFHAYHAFCVAERSTFRELHRRVLGTLLSRCEGRPREELPLLQALVQLDPLDSQCRARLFELLSKSGRASEVEQQARASERLFSELRHAPPPAAAEERISLLGSSPSHPDSHLPFVGRVLELERLGALVAAQVPGVRVALIEGDPGIGKSRLLFELMQREQARGVRVRRVALVEGRLGFPYAPFRELLQSLPRDALGPAYADAERALSAAGGRVSEGERFGRDQLFHALLDCFQTCAAQRPLLLAFEDVQWIDAGSLELLQYLAGAAGKSPLVIVITARRGELHDQPAVRRTVRALKRGGVLTEIPLGPLSNAQTEALVAALDAARDPAPVLAQSAGNPLLALELARHPEQKGEPLPASLLELIRDRIAALPPEPGDVLRWASVLGSSVDPKLLGRLLTYDAELLVEMLEHLERHGFLQLAEGPVRGACSFAHDVVRHAVYDQLSEPRRRLMHARIAHLLMDSGPLDDERAALVAHHASLGADQALAARACLAAGERCLRVFAPHEALLLARRGLSYAATLAEDEGVPLSLELLHVAIQAQRPLTPDLCAQLAILTPRALDLGAMRHARLGFYLQSLINWEDGRTGDAGRFSREGERVSRGGDVRERVHGLSQAALCMICLEQELPDAEAFLLEAEALAERAGQALPVPALLARGALQLYRGECGAAEATLEEARQSARAQGSRLDEFYALEWLVDLALQQEAYARAEVASILLCELGERLRQGSELPLARAFRALAAYAAAPETDSTQLSDAIVQLDLADAKQRSALVLARAAVLQLARGELTLARDNARRALQLAHLIARTSEAQEARAVLACIAHAQADRAAFESELRALDNVPPSSALAQRLVFRARALAGEPAQSVKKTRKGVPDGTRDRRAKAN